MKYANLKINLIYKFHVKNIPYSLRRRKIFKEKNPIFKEKNIPYSLRRGIFLLSSKGKQSEIRNKFIELQRKCSVEQPTNKVKKIKISARI